jgi:thiol-disulfide isomerase/thioredoxin
VPERQPSFLARLGALLLSPRRLARRDLDAHDGKASDDFLILAVLALILEGASALVHAASALAAGRYNGALRYLQTVAKPAVPLLLLWMVAAALYSLFTIRATRRAPGELGARVAQMFVLTSLVIAPLANALDPGSLHYTLASLPWATSAMWFGLGLRESLEPPGDASPTLPQTSRAGGVAMALAIVIGGAMHLVQSFRADANVPVSIAARPGRPAPRIDLPLLGGGRLELKALAGRPVLITFWATWCGPCIAELPELQRAYAARSDKAPLVYAINVDQQSPTREARVRAVVQRLGLTFPVALDDGPTSDAYDVTTIPTAVRIDEAGSIRDVFDHPLDASDLRDALKDPR